MRREGVAKGTVAGLLAGVLAMVGSTVAMAGEGAPSASASCQGADVRVGLLPATMHGTLCVPARGPAGTVMVLVPGATYNQAYWNFPFQPQTYNFRQAMNRAGYATLVVDRLGTGDSSRPLSALLTSSGQAAAVHAAIQALRAGRFGGISFTRVIVGGHSLGSAIAILEASTYHDVDGVLLTGYGHHVNLLAVAGLFLSFYPAALDPQLQAGGYDPGYLTTRPGTRAADYYSPATTDAGVVAADEATKDVWSALTEAPDGLGFSVVVSLTGLIEVPVLVANGGADDSLCSELTHNCASADAFRAQEAPHFSPLACLSTFLLRGSGHSLNLATDAPDYQRAVTAWADTFVGAGSNATAAPSGPCPR
jgi:pimeloyl-ACP methyl ester carboxylesterase